jgi:LysM repeat protein
MKTPRRALYLGGIGMLIVLGLMAGCYRPVAPDVTPTSPVSVEATPSAEELMETADAEAAETEEAPTDLFRIALRYGTTVQAIASANGIANPARIYVGQRLVIFSSGVQPTPQPGGETTYVVQRGDNLYRIALRYGLNYLYLAQYNGIANPSRIYAGQVLRIPPR